jgi:hypothetical protein
MKANTTRAPKRSTLTKADAAQHAKMFELPHEWLFRVARGEPIRQRRLRIHMDPNTGAETHREWIEEEWYATFDQRMSAAKEAAPYYAPRLAAHTVTPGATDIEALKKLFAALADKLPG